MQQEGSQRSQLLNIVPRQKFQGKVSVKTAEEEKNLIAFHRIFIKEAILKWTFFQGKIWKSWIQSWFHIHLAETAWNTSFPTGDKFDHKLKDICFVHDACNSH